MLNIRHEIAKILERNHHFGGHQAWAQALHHHQLEAILPFVLGDLITQPLAMGGFHHFRELAEHILRVLGPESQNDDVRNRESHLLFIVMPVMLLLGGLVPQFGHPRIYEEYRPDGQLLVDDRLHQPLHIVGVGAGDGHYLQLLQWLDTDGHLADQPGGTFGLRNQVQLRPAELLHSAVRENNSRTDHVAAKPARFIGANAGPTLCQPPADSGRRVAGRVKPQCQALLGQQFVQLLPDDAGLDGGRPAVRIDPDNLVHPVEVDHNALLDRDRSAVAGGGLAAGRQPHIALDSPFDQFRQLFLGLRLDNSVRFGVTDQGPDQARNLSDVMAV